MGLHVSKGANASELLHPFKRRYGHSCLCMCLFIVNNREREWSVWREMAAESQRDRRVISGQSHVLSQVLRLCCYRSCQEMKQHNELQMHIPFLGAIPTKAFH